MYLFKAFYCSSFSSSLHYTSPTQNVARIKLYKSKLVVFPRKNSRTKKGDSPASERTQVEQVTAKNVLPLPTESLRIKSRKVTKEETSANVCAVLRKAHTDAKLWGQRQVREKKKAADAAKNKKKDDE